MFPKLSPNTENNKILDLTKACNANTYPLKKCTVTAVFCHLYTLTYVNILKGKMSPTLK